MMSDDNQSQNIEPKNAQTPNAAELQQRIEDKEPIQALEGLSGTEVAQLTQHKRHVINDILTESPELRHAENLRINQHVREVAAEDRAQELKADKSAEASEDKENSVSYQTREKSRVYSGELVSHGTANYNFSPTESPNYHATLRMTNNQEQVLWGTGLQQAISDSRAQVGDNIKLESKGFQAVQVRVDEKDSLGHVIGSHAKEAYRNVWQAEKIEKTLEAVASVAQPKVTKQGEPSEQAQQERVDQPVNSDMPLPTREGRKVSFEKHDYELPSSVAANYVNINNAERSSEPSKFYHRDNRQVVAFEDKGAKLTSSQNDTKTVSAMLDVAKAKGWESLVVKGTAEFRREAWLEGQSQGINIKGYKPDEKDLVELEHRRIDKTKNEISASPIEQTKPVVDRATTEKTQAEPVKTPTEKPQDRSDKKPLNDEQEAKLSIWRRAIAETIRGQEPKEREKAIIAFDQQIQSYRADGSLQSRLDKIPAPTVDKRVEAEKLVTSPSTTKDRER
jgi:hypothetical protein